MRRLLNEIARTDVVVYVEVAANPAVPLARTAIMNSAGKGRYMLVSLNPDFDEPTRIGLFAHELQHVIEIAAHPWVTDPASLRRLYRHIASNPMRKTGSKPTWQSGPGGGSGGKLRHHAARGARWGRTQHAERRAGGAKPPVSP